MPAPLVTVGIPFFNEEQHLGAAIRSVLRQTLMDLEILLIDDGSTDRSLEIARSFSDPRLVVVSDGERRHLARRLNELAERSRGRFVARMDADDVAHPERLQKQFDLLREGACDAVGTWAGLVDEEGEPFSVVEAAAPVAPRVALERGILPHATLLAGRDWMLAHPYDESLLRAEDRDLWCRTVESTRFAIVAEPLYVVRVLAREQTFLPKYLATQRENRRLFRRYGPAMLGRPGTLRALAVSHFKSLAMRVGTRADLMDRIVRRRGRSPTDRERAMIQAALVNAEE